MTADRIGLTLIACLTAVIPTAHTTGLRNTLAGLLALLVIGWTLRYRKLAIPGYWLVAWIAVCLVSTLWSVAPGLSFGDALGSALLPVLCAFGAAFWIRRHIDAIVGLVFPLLFALVALMVLRFAHLANGGDDGVVERVYENYWPGRGVLSTLAIMILPLAVWLIAIGRRNLGLGLFAVTVIAGLQNWNRMFWIAMLVTLIPCLFMFRLSRRVLVVLGLAGVLLVGAGAYYSASLKYAAQNVPGEVVADTVKKDVRWDLWRDWTGLVVERPWAGYGYGLRSTHQIARERLPQWVQQGIFHPHNIFLGLAVQLGLLGFFAYGGLLVDFVRRFWGRRLVPESRAAALGGIALIAGMVSKNLTDDFMYHGVALLFWLLLGGFFALAGLTEDSA